jgi:hypothetical protein
MEQGRVKNTTILKPHTSYPNPKPIPRTLRLSKGQLSTDNTTLRPSKGNPHNPYLKPHASHLIKATFAPII